MHDGASQTHTKFKPRKHSKADKAVVFLTNLTTHVPHLYWVIVRGINPFASWINSAELAFVVLTKVNGALVLQLESSRLTK